MSDWLAYRMAGLWPQLKAFAIGLGVLLVIVLLVRWVWRWIDHEADQQSS